MNFLGILLTSVGLSGDGFAVAVTKGFLLPHNKFKNTLRISIAVGIFHVLMFVAGWFLGDKLASLVDKWDHWVAFTLLTFISGKVLYEAFVENEVDDEEKVKSLSNKVLLGLAVATSIDAFILGTSFAFMGENWVFPALVIGLIVGIITAVGFAIGGKFKLTPKMHKVIEIGGALILFGIGLKTLLGHIL